MTKIRFIHAADLHLDTPFKGLSNLNKELAERLKDATFRSFKNIIEICLKERVDFLVICGDIFDAENKSLAAQLKLISELKRLSSNQIPTYFICGNHDPLSSWLNTVQLPENVFRFGSSSVEKYTYKRDADPIADIYGISFQNRALRENLAIRYQFSNTPSPISIALLHGTVGSAGPHEDYAPFRIDDVKGKVCDYWALGHIHKRHVVYGATPAIVYPGNPQGRDFGETGAKGCYLVEITKGQPPRLRFIPAQLIRFEEIEVDLNQEDRIDNLEEKIDKAKRDINDYDEDSSYILRITLRGRTPLHSQLSSPQEIEQLTGHLNEGQLNQENFTWIDRIELNTQPDIDIGQIKKGTDFPAEILRIISEYEEDAEELEELIKSVNEELTSPQAKRELGGLCAAHEQKEILRRAKWLLLDQLIRES